jgi:hypothetical protein
MDEFKLSDLPRVEALGLASFGAFFRLKAQSQNNKQLVVCHTCNWGLFWGSNATPGFPAF